MMLLGVGFGVFRGFYIKGGRGALPDRFQDCHDEWSA